MQNQDIVIEELARHYRAIIELIGRTPTVKDLGKLRSGQRKHYIMLLRDTDRMPLP